MKMQLVLHHYLHLERKREEEEKMKLIYFFSFFLTCLAQPQLNKTMCINRNECKKRTKNLVS